MIVSLLLHKLRRCWIFFNQLHTMIVIMFSHLTGSFFHRSHVIITFRSTYNPSTSASDFLTDRVYFHPLPRAALREMHEAFRWPSGGGIYGDCVVAATSSLTAQPTLVEMELKRRRMDGDGRSE